MVYNYFQGYIWAYDMHSEASMRVKHSTVTDSAVAINILGITVSIDLEGNTQGERATFCILTCKWKLKILEEFDNNNNLKDMSFISLI